MAGGILWSDKEINKLKLLYSKSTKERLCNEFKGRSYIAIEGKAKKIGLKRDTRIKPIIWFDNITNDSIYMPRKFEVAKSFLKCNYYELNLPEKINFSYYYNYPKN